MYPDREARFYPPYHWHSGGSFQSPPTDPEPYNKANYPSGETEASFYQIGLSEQRKQPGAYVLSLRQRLLPRYFQPGHVLSEYARSRRLRYDNRGISPGHQIGPEIQPGHPADSSKHPR